MLTLKLREGLQKKRQKAWAVNPVNPVSELYGVKAKLFEIDMGS
jgi:hypothetical protein